MRATADGHRAQILAALEATDAPLSAEQIAALLVEIFAP